MADIVLPASLIVVRLVTVQHEPGVTLGAVAPQPGEVRQQRYPGLVLPVVPPGGLGPPPDS